MDNSPKNKATTYQDASMMDASFAYYWGTLKRQPSGIMKKSDGTAAGCERPTITVYPCANFITQLAKYRYTGTPQSSPYSWE